MEMEIYFDRGLSNSVSFTLRSTLRRQADEKCVMLLRIRKALERFVALRICH